MRPTYLQYKELYEYDSCASFVADYLTYEPLKIPNEVVRRVIKLLIRHNLAVFLLIMPSLFVLRPLTVAHHFGLSYIGAGRTDRELF